MEQLRQNMYLEDGNNDVDDEPLVVDAVQHSKLIADVQSLGNKGKSKYKFQRSEVSNRVSEFGLPSASGQLLLNDLVGDSAEPGLKKALKRIQRSKYKPSTVLEPVVLKPEEEKHTRIVAYDQIKEEMNKWGPVVWENRVAPTLHFPLEKPKLRVQSLKEYADDFTPTNDMEAEVMQLLNEGSELNQIKRSHREEAHMKRRALEEIRHRRAELIKQRMKVTYEAQKAKHRNRIKSRRYHQVQRRQKLAIQKKAEENATPEEEATILAKKLADIERTRIEERASLRHRPGGSKFADKQKMMARFDSATRQAVENMSTLSKHLTEKPVQHEDIDEPQNDISDGENDAMPVNNLLSASGNPWLQAAGNKVVNDKKASVEKQMEKSDVHYTTLKKMSAVDEMIQQDDVEFHSREMCAKNDVAEVENDTRQKTVEKDIPKTIKEVLGKEVERVEPVLAPSLITETPHNPDSQRLDVAAAFAEDDVVAEFEAEKQRLVNKEQPQDIDLSLAGWGDWAGPGIAESSKKKKRFVLKAQKLVRRDEKMPHVILKEAPKAASEAMSKHQPNSVPFPFSSAQAYERSLRQPVGREWVPEFARQDLIKPRIQTQIGAIIKPIDSDSKIVKKKLDQAEQAAASKKAAKKKASLRAKLGKKKKEKANSKK